MEIGLIPALPESVRTILTQKLNFTTLSPVQCQVLDHYNSGNLIVQSKNGSGKSLALTLLVLMRNPKMCIVVAPTREIAIQLHDLINLFVPTTLLIGGLDIKQQKKVIFVRQTNVYVATIGRLLECVEREYILIDQCDCLLIDEADKFKVDVEGCQWQDINKVACNVSP